MITYKYDLVIYEWMCIFVLSKIKELISSRQ